MLATVNWDAVHICVLIYGTQYASMQYMHPGVEEVKEYLHLLHFKHLMLGVLFFSTFAFSD